MLTFEDKLYLAIKIHAEWVKYSIVAYPYNRYDSRVNMNASFSYGVNRILAGVRSVPDLLWFESYFSKISHEVAVQIGVIKKHRRLELRREKEKNLLSFDWPLTEDEKCRAIHYISRGKGVRIGGCYICAEEEVGLIWGTDLYGCDGVASNNLNDYESVIEWVAYQYANENHPAE